MSSNTNDPTFQPFQKGQQVEHKSGIVGTVEACERRVVNGSTRWVVDIDPGNGEKIVQAWPHNCKLVADRPEWLASYELHVLAQSHAEWSRATFGADNVRGPVGPLKHLRKEIDEILANPSDPMEYADAFLLLLDAARRADIGSAELLRAAARKLEINKAREWPKIQEADAAIEHVRKMEPEEKTPGVSFEFVKSADLEPVAYSGGAFVGISEITGAAVHATQLKAEIETLAKQRDEAREELKEATAEFVRALAIANRERDEANLVAKSNLLKLSEWQAVVVRCEQLLKMNGPPCEHPASSAVPLQLENRLRSLALAEKVIRAAKEVLEQKAT